MVKFHYRAYHNNITEVLFDVHEFGLGYFQCPLDGIRVKIHPHLWVHYTRGGVKTVTTGVTFTAIGVRPLAAGGKTATEGSDL